MLGTSVNGLWATGFLLLLASTSALASDPAATCESSKLGITGKYASCRLRADAKAAKGGTAPDYSKCLLAKFADAEAKANGACPSNGDQAAVGAFVDACTESLAVALDGDPLPLDVLTCNADLATCNADLASAQAATCGNATAEYGEACDGVDLHGKSCATQAPSTPYGTLACNGACDGFDTSGCRPRFTDNGDGTITDHSTRRMWEKKTTAYGTGANYADPHDSENTYAWSNISVGMDGTVTSSFLAGLNGAANGACFAGHCDWRIPTLEELVSLRDNSSPTCAPGGVCMDPVFGGNMALSCWTANTDPDYYPDYAVIVGFLGGTTPTSLLSKSDATGAIAVRSVD